MNSYFLSKVDTSTSLFSLWLMKSEGVKSLWDLSVQEIFVYALLDNASPRASLDTLTDSGGIGIFKAMSKYLTFEELKYLLSVEVPEGNPIQQYQFMWDRTLDYFPTDADDQDHLVRVINELIATSYKYLA